eukprot:COSAG02_NODE_970_length_15551_cov_4.985698_16_plen_835_part_01
MRYDDGRPKAHGRSPSVDSNLPRRSRSRSRSQSRSHSRSRSQSRSHRSRSRSDSPDRRSRGRSADSASSDKAGSQPDEAAASSDLALPIAAFREEIVASVRENKFLVVIGETGSGKTTKLAQYLLDAGLTRGGGRGGAIAVTQPRRVAAIGAAQRVSAERDGRVGEEVGYSVRLENACSDKTRIKFLTDGMLLRECLSSPTLDGYSIVILDEAHERSVATDIMFTLLKKASDSRPDLRVVVTSATLDDKKFAKYFCDCPVIKVPGRQYPVEIMWKPVGGGARAGASQNNLARAVSKAVVDLHMTEGEGHILGFLTGQDEVEKACQLVVSALRELEELGEEPPEYDIWLLPCYGAMTAAQQADIFREMPENTRKVILATNIAETSITVQGIRYVVDGGFVKQSSYLPSSGMSTLQTQRISRVQATQRAGRAGRTGPGKCLRLYGQKEFELMAAETPPEIQRTNLEDVVLYLKELKIKDVLGVDFLDQPDKFGLVEACKQLYLLGALDSDGEITALGRQMAKIPVEPALARVLLAAAAAGDILEDVVTVVAMLGSEEGGGVWIRPTGDVSKRREADLNRAHFARDKLGDQIALLRLYNDWQRSGESSRWCTERWVHGRSLSRAKALRELLMNALPPHARDMDSRRRNDRSKSSSGSRSGGDKRLERIRVALCYGLYMRAAERNRNGGYYTLGEQRTLVLLHPSSSVLPVRGFEDDNEDESALDGSQPHQDPVDVDALPRFVLYQEIVATSEKFMRQIVVVEEDWIRPMLQKIDTLDPRRLMGGKPLPAEALAPGRARAAGGGGAAADPTVRRNNETSVNAARERYLARKKAAEAKAG